MRRAFVHKKAPRGPAQFLLYLFNFYAEYIVRNAGLEEAQAGVKITKKIITSDMQMTPPLWQKMKKNYRAS